MTHRHLYIAGWGRSGSTLLGGMLGAIPGWVNVGELRYVWDRGYAEDRVCSCGEIFSSCPFWTAVNEATGEQAARFSATRERHLRTAATLPRILRHRGRSGRQLSAYRDATLDLAGRIAAHTASDVVVDSSKSPLDALLLATHPSIDLDVIHLVRDPRAVAFSWAREKFDPGQGALLARKTALLSSARWVERNLICRALLRRRSNLVQIRYEDLVADPELTVNRALDELGLAGRIRANGPSVGFDSGHAVSGNPARFADTSVEVRPDDAWRDEMSGRDRVLATMVATPLLATYHYPIRIRGRTAEATRR